MPLSQRDMELVKLSSREAAFAAIRETEDDHRRMSAEEARKIVKEHADDCPGAQVVRNGRLRVPLYIGLIAGSGGLMAKLPDIIDAILARF